jgi:hypothetical protein
VDPTEPKSHVTPIVSSRFIKAAIIWVIVWLIARSVTDEDLREYSNEKKHRERFNKYVLQKNVRDARRKKAKKD